MREGVGGRGGYGAASVGDRSGASVRDTIQVADTLKEASTAEHGTTTLLSAAQQSVK